MPKEGMRAVSEFDDLDLEMRKGVVFCWLQKEDDRMWGKRADYVYVTVTIEEDRCTVAEMDFASLSMMYRQGSGGRPKNHEAVRLLAELYRTTSVPLSRYKEKMFSTPEVLVKGDIGPESIEVLSQE